MLSIKENITNELIINKSKFITKLIKINNENDVKDNLNKIKIEYSNATHYCYGYIINNQNKASDDGEPSGTAGLPILNVLKQNNLDYLLCIVIRYFGGIKLGTGGLVRAYTNSVVEALKKSEIIELQKGKLIVIQFNYDLVKNIDYLLKDSRIINKEFKEKITYEVILNNQTFAELTKHNIDFEIKEEIFI